MQLQSQFEALHRVFSAHSKAEDDLIWPALRAKAGRAGEPVADTLEGTFEEDHHDEEGAHNTYLERDVLLPPLRVPLQKAEIYSPDLM